MLPVQTNRVRYQKTPARGRGPSDNEFRKKGKATALFAVPD
jgi:hypothetical protein